MRAFLCVCACVSVWEPSPFRLCDDVTGAVQGGLWGWEGQCGGTAVFSHLIGQLAGVFLPRLFLCLMCQSPANKISPDQLKPFTNACACVLCPHFKSLSPSSLSLLPLSLDNVLELEKGRKWFGLIINNDIHRSRSERCEMGRPLPAYFRPQSLDE